MNKFLYAGLGGLLFLSPVNAGEYDVQLDSLAKGRAQEIAQNALVILAVEAQNEMTASYDQAKIDELDQQWRAEVDASSKPLIDKLLGNDLSSVLKQEAARSDGLFTEIFVMDAKGLNVGQSAPTSDYWQGDEAKWQKTYLAGPGSVDIGDVEMDESTGMMQAQVSVPVLNLSGEPIGAVTFGVNINAM
jgi:hypothetical protein